MMGIRRKKWILGAGLIFAVGGPASAETVAVAVAANFLEPLNAMAASFEQATGRRLEPRPGATGELYAQIVNGAPYDVFLSADAERPERLEREGLGVAGTRFTYAVGKLVLWSAEPGYIAADGVSTLRASAFSHLAIADPSTAPYGVAAMQVLERLKLKPVAEPKLVFGQNIGQAFQFVATGNAEVGFVALSQLEGPNKRPTGSRWLVPSDLYDPIRQDAILLSRAKDLAGAREFLRFLASDRALALVRSFGYGTSGP